MLYARTLEELGDNKATEEYQALCQYYSGAEAKCRYGLFLKSQGKAAELAEVFADLIRTSKRASKHSYQLNRQWIAVARQEMS